MIDTQCGNSPGVAQDLKAAGRLFFQYSITLAPNEIVPTTNCLCLERTHLDCNYCFPIACPCNECPRMESIILRKLRTESCDLPSVVQGHLWGPCPGMQTKRGLQADCKSLLWELPWQQWPLPLPLLTMQVLLLLMRKACQLPGTYMCDACTAQCLHTNMVHEDILHVSAGQSETDPCILTAIALSRKGTFRGAQAVAVSKYFNATD